MTDLNEALVEISANGKNDDAAELIEEAARRAQASYAAVRDDPTLSDAYKRQVIAQQAVSARAAVEADLIDMAGRWAGSDREDAASVFGIKGIRGDEAMLTISKRDAQDRVSQINEFSQLRALLTKATRDGDEPLARAVVQRAIELGDVETAEQFRAHRPELSDAVERLWKRSQRGRDTFGPGMALMNVMPEEFTTVLSAQMELSKVTEEPSTWAESLKALQSAQAAQQQARVQGWAQRLAKEPTR